MPLNSWSNLPMDPPKREEELARSLRRLPRLAAGETAIAQGAMRSYSDVALNPGSVVWRGAGRDSLIAFDREHGFLQAQGGARLADVLRVAGRFGWTLPIVPGTAHATLAGACANDVHGKNHHAEGSFGESVLGLGIWRSDREGLVEASEDRERGLFEATLGGMGLTGVIDWVRVRLERAPSSFFVSESKRFGSLDAFFELEPQFSARWSHVVAWVDCLASGRSLGRGILIGGRRASAIEAAGRDERPRRNREFPFTPPASLVGGVGLRAFNELYYRRPLPSGQTLEPAEPWLFPLDAIGGWNKMYGPRGFRQWQCRVPREGSRASMARILEAIGQSGQGSFLAVLKTFGPKKTPARLSFAQEGVTLALDFPDHGAQTLALLAKLDAIVFDAGGALYPAKDSRMDARMFDLSFPQWREWSTWRDPALDSAFARRTMGRPPKRPEF